MAHLPTTTSLSEWKDNMRDILNTHLTHSINTLSTFENEAENAEILVHIQELKNEITKKHSS